MSWITPDTVQLLFLPRHAPLRDELFSPLRSQNMALTQLQEPKSVGDRLHLVNKYILNDWAIRKWSQMEATLLLLDTAMRDALRATYPMDLTYRISLPRHYQYSDPNESEALVQQRVTRARASFYPLMAQVTMLFVLLDANDTGDWRAAIKRRLGISWQWLDDFEQSRPSSLRRVRASVETLR